jgi:hypothetical protein
MDTIGIDLHKRESQRCVIAEDGIVTERRIVTSRERFTAVLGDRRRARVASTETATARPVFERAFLEYGLPRAIRTVNGVPFATQAIHGLSYLTVWCMRLGIAH